MNEPVSDPNPRPRQRLLIGGALGIVMVVIGIGLAVRLWPRAEAPAPEPDLPLERIPPRGESGSPQTVRLFFVDPQSGRLQEESRTLVLQEDMIAQVTQVVQALLEGPVGPLRSAIPEGTELQHVFLDSRRVAYLDFSPALRERHPGGTTAEFLTVASIVATVLRNFPEQIHQVQILVGGSEVQTLAGHLDLSRPLTWASETPVSTASASP